MITKALRVISTIGSHVLNDADDIPMVSWSEDEKLPCWYIGAWNDSLDFLGVGHELAGEQHRRPQRMFFVFNIVPATMADVELAIREWAKTL